MFVKHNEPVGVVDFGFKQNGHALVEKSLTDYSVDLPGIQC